MPMAEIKINEWACDNCHEVFYSYSDKEENLICPACESYARFCGEITVFFLVGESSKEELKLLYYLATHGKAELLHFRTTLVDTDTAKELVDIEGQVNNFYPERVKAVMDKLRGKVSGYELGRDGTPLIYVHLPYWTDQREYNREKIKREISPAERERLVKFVIKLFKEEALADSAYQLTYRDSKLNIVRVWWD